MNVFNTTLKMVTPDQPDRRTVLQGVTLGAGAKQLGPRFIRSEIRPKHRTISEKLGKQ
jgi:hypothetical protein